MEKKRQIRTGFKACRTVKHLPSSYRIGLGWGAYRQQWAVAREDGTYDIMQRRVNPRTGMDVTEIIDWVRIEEQNRSSVDICNEIARNSGARFELAQMPDGDWCAELNRDGKTVVFAYGATREVATQNLAEDLEEAS